MPAEPNRRVSVAVFFGGQSSEHEISCLTTAGVLGALDTSRFEAHGVGITRDGRWVRYSAAEMAGLRAAAGGGMPSVDGERPPAVLIRDGRRVLLATRQGDRLTDMAEIDVALPLLHGPFGEDGTIQGYFEMLGLPYAGAGVAASALGMDKPLAKLVFAAAGLRVEPYIVLDAQTSDISPEAELRAVAAADLRYPLYVKPARSGSSVGISRVEAPDALAAAISQARRFDRKVIVEQGVVGAREIECAVLGPRGGKGETRVSRPGEIVMRTKAGFYDYEAKYLAADEADLVVPADLPPAVAAAVQKDARRAFEAIGATGLSRVDFFILPDGAVIISEINTMPGFTEISMFPKMWRAEGMTYQELITDLLEQALAAPAPGVG